MDFTSLTDAYTSALDDVTTSVQKQAAARGRLTDLTDDKLSAYEVAFDKTLDYDQLLRAGKGMVGGQSQALSSDLSARYGKDLPVTQRLDEAAAGLKAGGGMDEAGSKLSEVADALPGTLAEKNAALLGDLAQSKPGSMAAMRQAMGSEGQPLADKYQSLQASRARAANPAAVDGALSSVRGQMAGLLETKRNQYTTSAAQTADIAQSFTGKNPTQLLSEAQKARSRVALVSERNLENSTTSYSRLLDRENMKQTLSAEFDTATSQFKDYNYLTKLYALLQLYQHIKPPTI